MTTAPATALKRVRSTFSSDEDPSRGGDLMRLLKPIAVGHAKKTAMIAEAYNYAGNQRIFETNSSMRTIPDGIKLAMEDPECTMKMGLFPEIGRAWIAVDHILFLWDYNQPGNAYESFTMPNGQIIATVGLCKPKAGFEAISSSMPTKPDYVLVLATFITTMLVRLDRKGLNGWELTDAQLNWASTEGVLMTCIQGTSDGRIFMAGEDGSIHEFCYETRQTLMHSLGVKRQCFTQDRSRSSIGSALSWLLPPVVQKLYSTLLSPTDPLIRLEVDDGRKLLYSISKKGVISMFSLSKPDTIQFICSLDLSNLERSMDMRSISSSMVGVKDMDLKSFEICSVDVVSQSTSSVHLIVTSKSGIRIFFTTYESVSAAATSSQAHSRVAGKRLNPIAIRAPPDYSKLKAAVTSNPILAIEPVQGTFIPASANPAPYIPKSFTASEVCFFVVDDPDVGQELLGLSLDMSSASVAKWETDLHREQVEVNLIDRDLRVQALKELPPSSAVARLRQHWARAADRLEDSAMISDLVTQIGPFEKRKFLVLTNKGVKLIERNRPIDVLAALLARPDEVANQLVPRFFRRFGLDESCAMALVLASQASFSQEDNMFKDESVQANISRKASRFFSYLGFAIPPMSNGEKEFALPSLKSLREQETKKAMAMSALVPITSASSTSGGGSALVVSNASSSSATGRVSSQRAVLAVGGAPSARDLSNKSIDEVEADVLFSGCFEGLVLVTSRLLRPIWQWTILTKGEFRWTMKELEQIRAPLVRLIAFMRDYAPFSNAVKKEKLSTRQSFKEFTPALVEEIRTEEIYTLLRRVVEALTFFIEVQGDRKFSVVFKPAFAGNKEEYAAAEKMTWEDFVATDKGQVFARTLVRALIDSDKSMRNPSFLNKLSDTCGEFFSKNYVMHIQAMQEFETAAKSSLRVDDMVKHLGEATKILSRTFQAGLSTTQQQLEALERLKEACLRCVSLNEFWRAVELCIELAHNACDLSGIDPSVPPSHRGSFDESPVSRFRYACYEVAIDSLFKAEAASSSSVSSSSSAAVKTTGNNTLAQTVESSRTPGEAFKRALEVVLRSSDSYLQFLVFSRLLDLDKTQILIDCIPSSAIASFLPNPVFNSYQQNKHKDAHLVLYAKWLARHDRLNDASKTFRKLAELDEPDEKRNPTVFDRLEYISEALVYNGDNESTRRRMAIVRSTISLREALLRRLPENDPIINELTYRRMKESRLVDIASEQEMDEEVLGLLQAFGKDSDKSEQVYNIYGNILGPFLPEWRVSDLAGKITSLAQRFGEDPQMFPLHTLVQSLEAAGVSRTKKLRGKREFDSCWLINALLDGKITIVRIFVVYAQFFEGQELQDAQYVLKLLLEIIDRWVKMNLREVQYYSQHPLPSDVDLGSVTMVLERASRQFKSTPDIVDEINGRLDDISTR